MEPGERWGKVVALMARLRGPQGCPWDRKQTLHSLRPFILEEAYELVDAIEQDEGEAIREETGDLLLEVLFVSQICAERGLFTSNGVLEGLEAKMVRRHPHVFGDQTAGSAGEALAKWEEIKDAEKESDAPAPRPRLSVRESSSRPSRVDAGSEALRPSRPCRLRLDFGGTDIGQAGRRAPRARCGSKVGKLRSGSRRAR